MIVPITKATIKQYHVSSLHCVIKAKQTTIDNIGKNGTQGALNSPSFGSPKSLRSLITPKASKIRYASVTILTNKARISKGKTPEKNIVTIPTNIVAFLGTLLFGVNSWNCSGKSPSQLTL